MFSIFRVFLIFLFLTFPIHADPDSDLIDASLKGDLVGVKAALKAGANVDARTGKVVIFSPLRVNDYSDATPLIIASGNGKIEIVKFLIQNNADVNSRSTYGDSPLHYASINGHLEIVKILIQNNANINAKNNLDQTSLHASVKGGQLEIVKILIKSNVDYNFNKGKSIYVSALEGQNIEIFNLLISNFSIFDNKYNSHIRYILFFQILQNSLLLSDKDQSILTELLYQSLLKRSEMDDSEKNTYIFFLAHFNSKNKILFDYQSNEINKNINFIEILPYAYDTNFTIKEIHPEIYFAIARYFAYLDNFSQTEEYFSLGYDRKSSLIEKAKLLKYHDDLGKNYIQVSYKLKKGLPFQIKIKEKKPKMIIQIGHTSMVNQTTFSPDGNTIATISNDNTAKLWNKDGKLIATLKGHTNDVRHVAFSPDGKTIATASWDHTAKLWTLDGKLITTLEGHKSYIEHVSFSLDGNTIATASRDYTAKLWTKGGNFIYTLKGHTGVVNQATFSPDGNTIATVSMDETTKIWNMDGNLISTLKGHTSHIKQATFSPDGNMIATASEDNTAKLWTKDGKLISTLEGHTRCVNLVTFSLDGRYIFSGSKDNTIHVFDL
ncbi:MAG: ankyrin repeat domain-containing protein, partial [Leptospiraceae bacterium]|nr:ankyrin repeat domain-containing protein [Leptospiraceae bacterium]